MELISILFGKRFFMKKCFADLFYVPTHFLHFCSYKVKYYFYLEQEPCKTMLRNAIFGKEFNKITIL